MGNRVAWEEGEKEKSYWLQQPPLPEVSEGSDAKAEEQQPTEDASMAGAKPEDASNSEAPKEGPSLFRHDQNHRKSYRIPPEVLDRVRSTINKFLGSHNFWNFTVGKEFGDRSCQRVMKKLTVSEPFMVNDNEWVSLKFHGQSFMLHQIRKMVGLLIMMVRTRTPPSLIPECFGPTRLNIPKAPALGLLLEQPIFENYNKKVEESNRKAEEKSLQNLGRKASKETEAKRDAAKAQPKDENMEEEGASSVPATPTADASKSQQQDDPADLIRDPVSYEHIEEKVEHFKREIVFKTMHGEEEKDDTYAKWLNLHDSQIGPDFE
jgi:tRNA pseudouridine38-40 synthase